MLPRRGETKQQTYSSPAEPTHSIFKLLDYLTSNFKNILTKDFNFNPVTFILPLDYLFITVLL
jgi:hypothetical protein